MAVQTDSGLLVFNPHSRGGGDDDANSIPYPKNFKGIGILPTLTTEGSLQSKSQVKDLLGCVQSRVRRCQKKLLASGSNYEGCSTCGAGKAYLKCKGKPPMRGKDFGSEYKPGPPLGRTMPPEPKKLSRKEKDKIRDRIEAARNNKEASDNVEKQKEIQRQVNAEKEEDNAKKAEAKRKATKGRNKNKTRDKSGNYLIRKDGSTALSKAPATGKSAKRRNHERQSPGADFDDKPVEVDAPSVASNSEETENEGDKANAPNTVDVADGSNAEDAAAAEETPGKAENDEGRPSESAGNIVIERNDNNENLQDGEEGGAVGEEVDNAGDNEDGQEEDNGQEADGAQNTGNAQDSDSVEYDESGSSESGNIVIDRNVNNENLQDQEEDAAVGREKNNEDDADKDESVGVDEANRDEDTVNADDADAAPVTGLAVALLVAPSEGAEVEQIDTNAEGKVSDGGNLYSSLTGGRRDQAD